MLRSNLVLIMGGLLAFGGCGGDEDGGGFSSGVSGSKRVDQLTPAEEKTFCDKGDAFFSSDANNVAAGSCRFAAQIFLAALGGNLSAAQKETACNDAVMECLAEEPEDEPNMCEATKDCAATVAEVEACVNDSWKRLKDYLNETPSCAKIAAGATAAAFPSSPMSCQDLKKKCPNDDSDFTTAFKEGLEEVDLDEDLEEEADEE